MKHAKRKNEEIKKIGSLQIERDALKINKAFDIFQKSGIILMFLVLVGGILGLFGNGILSNTKNIQPNFTVDYTRFVRLQATHLLNFAIRNEKNDKYNVIWIGNNFLKKNIIRNIIPEPILQEFFDNGVLFTFQTQPSQETVPRSEQIMFVIEPEKFGFLDYDVRVNNKEKVNIHQFIYP